MTLTNGEIEGLGGGEREKWGRESGKENYFRIFLSPCLLITALSIW